MNRRNSSPFLDESSTLSPSFSITMHLSEDQREVEPQHKADVVIQENVQRKWQSYLWDTLDKSPVERKFLFKLDFALLTFASLGTSIQSFLCMKTDTLRLLHQVSGSG